MSPEVLSPLLLEAQGIRYAIANETFGGAIIELLSECFSREPMSAALGLSARDLAPLVARFVPESTTNGLSVIAMPADHSEILAGAFICRDFKSPPPAGVPGDFPWFSPIAEAVMTIDDAYEAKRPALVLGEAEDLWMVGVRPSAQFARQGIARPSFALGRRSVAKRNCKRCVKSALGTARKRLPGRPAFWNASASPIGTSASRDERYSPGSNPRPPT